MKIIRRLPACGKISLSGFLFLLFIPALHAGNGEIGDKLDSLANTLYSTYSSRYPGEKDVALAVLPFYASPELSKRRVGIAFAELLTHSFNRYPVKIVERLELNKVFDELKLSMSGVSDTEDALKIGKLANARLQVLGSIDKIGDKYHVNVRMIRTETGEIVATAYETLSVEAFEENAKYYLVPVPETQAIGLYFLYNLRHVPTASGSYSYPSGGGTTETVFPRSLSLGQLGVGLRYNPAKRLQVDVAGIYSGASNLAAISHSSSGSLSWDYDMKFGSIVYRGLLNYDFASNKLFHMYAGGGMIWHQVYKEMKGSYSSPLIHSRIEFKPQPRFALSIAINYELKEANWRSEYFYCPAPSSTHKPSKLSIEPAIGFYF